VGEGIKCAKRLLAAAGDGKGTGSDLGFDKGVGASVQWALQNSLNPVKEGAEQWQIDAFLGIIFPLESKSKVYKH